MIEQHPNPITKRHATGIVALVALALLVFVPAAAATQSRVPLGFSPIDGSGTGVTFGYLGGIGLDETSGNVFVNNHGSFNEVDAFGAEGGLPAGVSSPYKVGGFAFRNFERSGVAVDNATGSPAKGTLYVADVRNNAVKKFTLNTLTEQYEAAGELTPSAGPFNRPHAVTVDTHGNVFVADQGTGEPDGSASFGVIYQFSPSGTQLAKITVDGTAGQPASIAVDGAGDLFAAGLNGSGVYKYPANGSGQIELTGSEPTSAIQVSPVGGAGVAVDPATNKLFVAASKSAATGAVVEYDATSLTKGAEFGTGVLRADGDVVVNSATNRVYVVDFVVGSVQAGRIFVFGPPVTLPTATTAEASQVQVRHATLNGTVNAEGIAVSECKFEYGTSVAYGETAPCTGSIPTDSSDHAVSAALSGLNPGTTYHFRVVATNANGTNRAAADKAFTTSKTAVTGTGTPVSPTEAAVTGTVYPEGAPITECRFEYGKTETYGSIANCAESESEIGSGTGAVGVHAAIGGLQPSSTYHFRIVAKSQALAQAEAGADALFSSRGPLIAEASVNWNALGSTSAGLAGKVSPNGEATTYRFEYVTKSQFELNGFADAAAAPPGGAPLGDGEAQVAVSQQLSGLSPATAYVARLTATNSSNTAASANLEFSTYPSEPALAPCANDVFRNAGPAGGLPDCRAYEQVTPIEKGGANASGNVATVSASSSGDGITYISSAYIPGTVGTGETRTHYVARRSGGSWATGSLDPSPSYGRYITLDGWAAEAGLAGITEASKEGGADRQLVYTSPSGAYSVIAPYSFTPDPEEGSAGRFALPGASADGSKVFIEDRGGLLGDGAVAGAHNVYVWDRATGVVKLASVLPDSACGAPPCVPASGAFAGSYNWFGGGPATGGVGVTTAEGHRKEYYTRNSHAVSADGEKLFFTAAVTGQLYMREHPAGPGATTVQVSKSQGGSSEAKAAAFMEATPDGSTVFFTSCQNLTPDAHTVSTAAVNCATALQASDLYAYDVGSGKLTDLTPDPTDSRGADVKGMIGASADGSYVYFIANGDLDGSGPATLGECARFGEAVSGERCNLYLWHEGQSTLVASLDAEGEELGFQKSTSDASNWLPVEGLLVSHIQEKTARVSASGTLLFRSQRQLDSYDNEGVPELYRYQPGASGPTCVSCNPSGAAPASPATLQTLETVGIKAPVPTASQTRVLSADGSRVFFQTADKLLPSDTNGDHGCPVVHDLGGEGRSPACLDVYEWEANGAPGGSCHSSANNGGCLYLISSGTSPLPSYLGDASASGKDVFFFTADKLVPQDGDTLYDIYDASEGGGLASQQTPPPPCEGEACRGQGTSAPPASGAATASFAGPGNPKAEVKKCPKGRTQRKGRCVKPHHSKHKRKKARHHKRASGKHGGGK